MCRKRSVGIEQVIYFYLQISKATPNGVAFFLLEITCSLRTIHAQYTHNTRTIPFTSMENPLHKKRAAYWAALRFMIVGQVRRVELVGLIHRITNLDFDQD